MSAGSVYRRRLPINAGQLRCTQSARRHIDLYRQRRRHRTASASRWSQMRRRRVDVISAVLPVRTSSSETRAPSLIQPPPPQLARCYLADIARERQQVGAADCRSPSSLSHCLSFHTLIAPFVCHGDYQPVVSAQRGTVCLLTMSVPLFKRCNCSSVALFGDNGG